MRPWLPPTLALLLTATLASAQPPALAPRHFRMGCTLFPSDATLQALADVEQFAKTNCDIVAAHFEGVPWVEALSGEPFHRNLTNDWDRCLNALAPGSVIYLALTPLDMARADMSPSRAETEGMPIPPELAGKPLNDPLVIETYLAYCRRAIDHMKPTYLAIGIETNELFHNNRPKWDEYVALHRAVYAALKQDHPDLPIFASCTLHNLVNRDWQDREGAVSAWKDLMPYNDAVALSFYPFMSQPGKSVRECLEWVASEFDEFGKPYTIAEMGQLAEPLTLTTPPITLPGTPELQADAVDETLAFADAHPLLFVNWFVARDYDGLWDKMKDTAPEFFRIWKDCGLEGGEGNPRPALGIWQAAFARPLETDTAPAAPQEVTK